ncbi:uncharacterized protein LOC116936854 isoform X2 [Petromyzon marinus]|uniref:uncharacterized protein LOC116936854 isoform X2 n=1 Tax=Petromyzon marinus TaxID=7757 RepID=UPI003F6FD6A1
MVVVESQHCGLVPRGASVSPGSAAGLGSPWAGRSSSSEAGAASCSEDEALGGQPRQPRKRQRLSHLSAEEKLLRRKLKNRVAAQTARDRKKARMGELEEHVAQLEAQNARLQQENEELSHRACGLLTENRQLHKRLDTQLARDNDGGSGADASGGGGGDGEWYGSFESAELKLSEPQQKAQAQFPWSFTTTTTTTTTATTAATTTGRATVVPAGVAVVMMLAVAVMRLAMAVVTAVLSPLLDRSGLIPSVRSVRPVPSSHRAPQPAPPPPQPPHRHHHRHHHHHHRHTSIPYGSRLWQAGTPWRAGGCGWTTATLSV